MSEQANAENLLESLHGMESEIDSEHVSMGSGESATNSEADITATIELKKLRSTFDFASRPHGTRFAYELYDEGFLKVRKWKRNKLVRDYYLSLRFISPVAKVTRIVPR